MKRSVLTLLALALLASMTLAVIPAQQTAVADGHEKGDKGLHDAMEELGGLYKLVRRQARDESKNADTAEKLAKMIEVSAASKAMIPKTATTDDMKQKYRVIMNKLIIVLAEAENAALANDQDTLKAKVSEANKVKGEGHEMFIPDDE